MRHSRVIIVVAVIVVLASTSAYYYSTNNTYASMLEVSQYAIEYPLRDSSSLPNAIAVDSSGNVWFTLENASSLAELDSSNGVIHQYRIPTEMKGGTTSWGMVVDNSRRLVWFTEELTNSVWSFNMNTHKFTRYELKTSNGFPFGITLDGQGNVWFTEFFGNKIGEITQNGTISETAIPLRGYLEASGITVGPQGKIWFTLPGINATGYYYDGKFAIQNLTGLVLLPVGISFDNQGNAWITQHGPNFISEFNPITGYFESIATSVPSYYYSSLPYFDNVDQQGDVWFNEHEGNAMGEFIPSTDTLIEYFIPTRVISDISGMLTSALSPSGRPWFTEFFAGKVGTINITAPLDLHLSLPNYTVPILVSQKANVNIELRLSGLAANSATIKAFVGNFSSKITYDYSSTSQVFTLHTNASGKGVYFVTISAITSSLAVSKIIEVEVR